MKVWKVVGILLAAVSLIGAVPKTLNYQGKLYEGGGPVSGTRAVGYRLYKDVNANHLWDGAATDSLVWEQIPADVTVNDGLFTDTLDFSTGYATGYDFESVFGGGADLFLEVYVGPSGTYTDFTGTTPLSPVEVLRSSPYAFYAENAVNVTSIQNGTAADQTLRWDGSQWVPSDALLNDGTNVTVGGDLAVNGGDINGPGVVSGVNGILRIHSNTSVRVYLDNDANGSETFEITPNGTTTPVFQVSEGGNVTATGNGYFDGNLTLAGASGREINFPDGAGNIISTTGLDIILDSNDS